MVVSIQVENIQLSLHKCVIQNRDVSKQHTAANGGLVTVINDESDVATVAASEWSHVQAYVHISVGLFLSHSTS